MKLGPFIFTPEISLGSILTIASILGVVFKYLGHFVKDYNTRAERLDRMWIKFNGNYEDDPIGWFNRLEAMEEKVNAMWRRLKFNRVTFDASQRTRHTDG